MHMLVRIGVLATALVATSTPVLSQPCTGDCDGNLQVTVNELILGVNIALQNLSLSLCPNFDSNDNASVAVNELLQAVNNALCGCDHPCNGSTTSPTPTAILTPTAVVPTPTATPPPTLGGPTPTLTPTPTLMLPTMPPTPTPTLMLPTTPPTPTQTLIPSTPTPTSPAVGQVLFQEGWELSAVRRHVPNTQLSGDAGAWFNGDSISNDPRSCGGRSANYAQVIVEEGSHRLKLHSARNDTDCDDNEFIVPVDADSTDPRDLDIAVDDNLYLSFHETGALVDPDPCDAVIVHVEFDSEDTIDYLLQRDAMWDVSPDACGNPFVESPLLLPLDQASFVRNLNADAAAVGIAPVSYVTSITLEVGSHGDATFDDIMLFQAARAQ